jgi:hypothetical protein
LEALGLPKIGFEFENNPPHHYVGNYGVFLAMFLHALSFFFLKIEFSNQCDELGLAQCSSNYLIRPPAPEEYANKKHYERNEYQ